MVMSSDAEYCINGKLRVGTFHRFKNQRLRTSPSKVMAISKIRKFHKIEQNITKFIRILKIVQWTFPPETFPGLRGPDWCFFKKHQWMFFTLMFFSKTGIQKWLPNHLQNGPNKAPRWLSNDFCCAMHRRAQNESKIVSQDSHLEMGPVPYTSNYGCSLPLRLTPVC